MSFQLVDLRSFAGKGGIRKGTFALAMDLQLGYLGNAGNVEVRCGSSHTCGPEGGVQEFSKA